MIISIKRIAEFCSNRCTYLERGEDFSNTLLDQGRYQAFDECANYFESKPENEVTVQTDDVRSFCEGLLNDCEEAKQINPNFMSSVYDEGFRTGLHEILDFTERYEKEERERRETYMEELAKTLKKAFGMDVHIVDPELENDLKSDCEDLKRQLYEGESFK